MRKRSSSFNATTQRFRVDRGAEAAARGRIAANAVTALDRLTLLHLAECDHALGSGAAAGCPPSGATEKAGPNRRQERSVTPAVATTWAQHSFPGRPPRARLACWPGRLSERRPARESRLTKPCSFNGTSSRRASETCASQSIACVFTTQPDAPLHPSSEVDEGHSYKNLRTISNIPGAAIEGSQRARDPGFRPQVCEIQRHCHRSWGGRTVASGPCGCLSGWRRADSQSNRRPAGLAGLALVARRRPRTFGVA